MIEPPVPAATIARSAIWAVRNVPGCPANRSARATTDRRDLLGVERSSDRPRRVMRWSIKPAVVRAESKRQFAKAQN
jgi:hypothetical protein